MKHIIKWSSIALALVGIIIGATVLYGNLSDKYRGQELMKPPELKNGGDDNNDQNEVGSEELEQKASKEENSEGGMTETTDNAHQPNVEEPTAPSVETKPKVQMSAPDFTVIDRQGNEVKLSDYVGKPIVLNFWATWCYYCKQEMPDFNKAYKDYPDVNFVMVNVTDGVYETVDTAKTYVDKNGFEFDILFDTEGNAVDAYEVTGYPTTYFIDASGNPVAYASGMIDYNTLVSGIDMIR